MSEKTEAQAGATVLGWMKSESLSERIIQNFFSGTPDFRLTALADAAPLLLTLVKNALPIIDDAFQDAERNFAPRAAECFRLQAASMRAAIAEADASESATASSKPKEGA